MAIEDILKYVNSQTAEKCEKIIAAARRKADETEAAVAKEKERMETERKHRLAAARKISDEHHRRRARMTARKFSLDARREMLDGLYERLFKKVASSEDAKTRLYEKLLASIPQSPSAELVVSSLEQPIWSKLKKHVKCSAVAEGDFTGGFIYRTADASWDFTLENIFADFRRKTQSEAAAMIFEESRPASRKT